MRYLMKFFKACFFLGFFAIETYLLFLACSFLDQKTGDYHTLKGTLLMIFVLASFYAIMEFTMENLQEY